MPSYVRWREVGATYFFTVVTYKRRHIFSDEVARRILREAFAFVGRRLPFEMPACVLLPDHLHCVWVLADGDDDFPRRWRQIKERFTRGFVETGGVALGVTDQQRAQGRVGIWQPRYYEHRIRGERDYLQHRDYIHLNPVKHGYVNAPEDRQWSSFHRHVALGWLDPHWPGSSAVALPDVRE